MCRSAQLATVQELVGAGHGISMIPALASRGDEAEDRVYRELAGERPSRTIAAIWHATRYRAPIVDKLLESLAAEVRGFDDLTVNDQARSRKGGALSGRTRRHRK